MRGVSQILRHGSMLALLACAVAGCQNLKQVDNRGYVAAEDSIGEITVGKTTRDDVRRLLGSPSTVSGYPPETWYYISRERETVAFFAPELADQQIAQIEFDDSGYVSKLENFGLDAAQEIDYVSRKTPTEGRKMGVLEQLLGNVGRFNSGPTDSTQARQ